MTWVTRRAGTRTVKMNQVAPVRSCSIDAVALDERVQQIAKSLDGKDPCDDGPPWEPSSKRHDRQQRQHRRRKIPVGHRDCEGSWEAGVCYTSNQHCQANRSSDVKQKQAVSAPQLCRAAAAQATSTTTRRARRARGNRRLRLRTPARYPSHVPPGLSSWSSISCCSTGNMTQLDLAAGPSRS